MRLRLRFQRQLQRTNPVRGRPGRNTPLLDDVSHQLVESDSR